MYFTFNIHKCNNFTKPNFIDKCAKPDEIDAYINNLFVSTIGLNEMVDFKNIREPGKKPVFSSSVDLDKTTLSSNTYKIFDVSI